MSVLIININDLIENIYDQLLHGLKTVRCVYCTLSSQELIQKSGIGLSGKLTLASSAQKAIAAGRI
jgi:hypothetical protein